MSRIPLQLGVTGGLGAGKSMVCEIFQSLGIPVYNADHRARWLMENEEELIEAIKKKFGDKTYSGPKLNRDYLASQVFDNPEKLGALNALVHPRVRVDGKNWAKTRLDYSYLVREAALMIESGSYKDMDYLLVVTAPEYIRKQRVLKRDPFRSPEEVDDIMASQLSEEEKIKLSDFVLVNDGKNLLIPQVLKIHENLSTTH